MLVQAGVVAALLAQDVIALERDGLTAHMVHVASQAQRVAPACMCHVHKSRINRQHILSAYAQRSRGEDRCGMQGYCDLPHPLRSWLAQWSTLMAVYPCKAGVNL